MNVLIVDDEPLARERLARLVGGLEGCTVLGAAAGNGGEAAERVGRLEPGT